MASSSRRVSSLISGMSSSSIPWACKTAECLCKHARIVLEITEEENPAKIKGKERNEIIIKIKFTLLSVQQ